MQRYYYYFATSLPSLPPLGERPPLTRAELRERAAGQEGLAAVVDAVLLQDDLLQRQSYLAGEIEAVAPAVLTEEQARGEAPLPEPLQAGEGESAGAAVGDDSVWGAYYRYVVDVAAASGCDFLRIWVGFEVALRNALVALRAKTLRLNAEDYRVAPELGDDAVADLRSLTDRWQQADNLLEAQRALDQGRMEWLAESGGWFGFAADEAAAYAAGLQIVARWDRLARARDGSD